MYVFGLALIASAVFLYGQLDTRYWNGNSKLHVVYQNKDGDIEFSVLEPTDNEITTLIIPGDTEVEVARNLGVWKLKNVPKLGIQEKVGGKLLAETVTRSLDLPVYVWVGGSFKLSGVNVVSALKFVFTPVKTNLSVGDKIKLTAFVLRVPQAGKRLLKLDETGYIKSTRLKDGGEGYKAAGNIPPGIIALLAYPGLSNKSAAYRIVNESGDAGIAVKLGEIISVMGGKLAAIEKGDEKDIDCVVNGKDRDNVEITANVFSCIVGKNNSESNLDIEMYIGKKFAERF